MLGTRPQQQQALELQQVVERCKQHVPHVQLYPTTSTTAAASAMYADTVRHIMAVVVCNGSALQLLLDAGMQAFKAKVAGHSALPQ